MSTRSWNWIGGARRVPVLLALAVLMAAPAQAQAPDQQRLDTLRERIAERYDIVPLSRGVGLVPKSPNAGIRLIEVTDDGVALDGQAATGQELKTRLGADAELVIQLTYLGGEDRQRLARGAAPPAIPSAQPEAAPAPRDRESTARRRTRTGQGDRVRLFRSVQVGPSETVPGDVVAIFGSADIEGHVTGDVVAVMGSTRLGPRAEVGGDVVSVMGSVRLGADSRVDGDVVAVGGELDRGPGSQVGGEIKEVAFGPRLQIGDFRRPGFWPFAPVYSFGRLFLTLMRAILLALVASLVVLVAKGPVSRMAQRVQAEPVKAGLVGFLAEILFVPVLVVTCVVLAVSIIGIPLLLLVPFALVFLVLVLLSGFSGVAYVIGDTVTRRFGWSIRSPYALVWLGVATLLTPLVAARLVGLAGGLFNMFAVVLAGMALLIEYVAWTTGFGAAILGPFSGQKAAAPAGPAPPPDAGPAAATSPESGP